MTSIDPLRPTRRQVAYIAGPITANAAGDTAGFVETGRRVAEEMRKRGWSCILPHMNSFAIDGWKLDDYLAEDFELLQRCDFVVLLPHWRLSEGTKREVEFASERGIPVFDFRTMLPDYRA